VHGPSQLENIEVKSAVETLDPTKVKLTVEVPYDELKPSIDHAYAHIAEQVTVPGFRKGKVPARIIDQRVGRAAVLEHAINDGMSGFYRQAVNEANLRPLGQPEIEVTQLPSLTGRSMSRRVRAARTPAPRAAEIATQESDSHAARGRRSLRPAPDGSARPYRESPCA